MARTAKPQGEVPRGMGFEHTPDAPCLHKPIEAMLEDGLEAYYRTQLYLHLQDSYRGISLMKFPQDLRVYEHLIYACGVTVVVELGVRAGGSLLWFWDRLRTISRKQDPPSTVRVIGVDRRCESAKANLAKAEPCWSSGISLITGDVESPATASAVSDAVPPGAVCMVVEDSAHTAVVTEAALRLYAGLVSPGSFFVVEDGHRDYDALCFERWRPRRPEIGPVVRRWLRTNAEAFELRRDVEYYGITSSPAGYLRRKGGRPLVSPFAAPT